MDKWPAKQSPGRRSCHRQTRRWAVLGVLVGLAWWVPLLWAISVDGPLGTPPQEQDHSGTFELGGPLEGDVDGDGFVGGSDLSAVLTNWGAADPASQGENLGAGPDPWPPDYSGSGTGGMLGDLDGDGFVGGGDYSEILTNWGASAPATTHAPEPLTVVGLGLCVCALAGYVRKRRKEVN